MSSKKRGSGNIRNSDKTTTIVPTASSKWTSSNAMENTVNIVGRMQPFNNITEHDLREACERHDSTDYTNYDWQNARHTDSENDKAGINISNVAYDLAMKEYNDEDKANNAKKLASNLTCVGSSTEFTSGVLKSVRRAGEN